MPMIRPASDPVNAGESYCEYNDRREVEHAEAVDDEAWAEYLRMVDLVEHRHREYGEPLLPLAEWVNVQAAYYRSLETEAAALVAERLDVLVAELRALDAPSPAVFRDRWDCMEDVRR